MPGSSTCIYTLNKMYTFLKGTSRVDWYLFIPHTRTCILTKWNNRHPSSQGSNRQPAGKSYSDHVRKNYYIVVMGRSNSSGLCSVATWMHAIFFLTISAPHSIINWRWGSLWIQWLTPVAPCDYKGSIR